METIVTKYVDKIMLYVISFKLEKKPSFNLSSSSSYEIVFIILNIPLALFGVSIK